MRTSAWTGREASGIRGRDSVRLLLVAEAQPSQLHSGGTQLYRQSATSSGASPCPRPLCRPVPCRSPAPPIRPSSDPHAETAAASGGHMTGGRPGRATTPDAADSAISSSISTDLSQEQFRLAAPSRTQGKRRRTVPERPAAAAPSPIHAASPSRSVERHGIVLIDDIEAVNANTPPHGAAVCAGTRPGPGSMSPTTDTSCRSPLTF